MKEETKIALIALTVCFMIIGLALFIPTKTTKPEPPKQPDEFYNITLNVKYNRIPASFAHKLHGFCIQNLRYSSEYEFKTENWKENNWATVVDYGGYGWKFDNISSASNDIDWDRADIEGLKKRLKEENGK